MPILVIGLSVLDFGPMYATDRQTSDVRDFRPASSLNTPISRDVVIIRIKGKNYRFTTTCKVDYTGVTQLKLQK